MAELTRLILAKLGEMGFLTNDQAPMAPGVLSIFLWRRPPQIANLIVRRIAIPVGALMFLTRRGSNEMEKDEAMDEMMLRPAFIVKGDP